MSVLREQLSGAEFQEVKKSIQEGQKAAAILGLAALTPIVGPVLGLPTAVVESMYTGGAMGVATSTVLAATSERPPNRKVDAVIIGTALGALTGPLPLKRGAQVLSAMVSHDAAALILDGTDVSLGSNLKEGGKGYLVGVLGEVVPGGPVGKALMAGAYKLGLDLLERGLSAQPQEAKQSAEKQEDLST
jgi:hypothetical protein